METLDVLVLNGFNISTKQQLYFHRIINQLPTDLKLNRIKSIICPVLAKSYEDQVSLSAVIDKHLESFIEEIQQETSHEEDHSQEQKDPDNKTEENPSPQNPPENKIEDPGIQKTEQKDKNRKLRPKKIKGNNSSYIWNIVIEDKPKNLFAEQFNNTFGQLNYRKFLEGNEFNIKKTIDRATKKGVITDFYYKAKSQRASYLMLIQRDSFQNHESHFYESLYKSLKENDIDIERFFFYSDPRFCWNKKFKNGVSLYHIATRYSNSNLILSGNIERLINRKGRLRPWTDILNTWEKKILIPSNSLDPWNDSEKVLSSFFTLIPPIENEIKRLAKYILSNKFERINGWQHFINKKSHAILYKNSLLDTLQSYFEEDMIKWIAACAVYPTLYWDLSLFIGKELFQEKDIVSIENILQLTRIPWFKTGEIPPKAREFLLNHLDEENFKKITAAIISQMKKNPPEDSYASYDDYSFQLILYQLFLNPNDKQLLSRFHELNRNANIEKDMVLLEHLFQKSNKAREFLLDDPLNETSVLSSQGDIRTGDTVKGIIRNITDYGAFVSLGGLFGLVHISEITSEDISHPSEKLQIGQEVDVKILNIDERKGHITLSIKRLEAEELSEQLLSQLEVGHIVAGTVKAIKNYGAFINIGGVDGLLYLSDISWGRIAHPKNVLSKGDEIKVVIIDIDKNKKRVSLGLKQLHPSPWESVSNKLSIGSIVKGTIVNIENYGAFLQIEPGLEGLIHYSELTWENTDSSKLKNYFTLGEEHEAKVVTIDPINHKMSLSIRQLTEDPWNKVEEKYPIGSRHKARVKNLTPYGVFLEMEKGIYSFLHISDLSWIKRFSHPSQFTKIEEELEVIVMEIEIENKKFAVGHKQLEEDPWDTLEEVFKIGSYHEATVLSRDERSAIVQLSHKLEAYVPIKHLRKEDESLAEVGETLNFKVLELLKDDKRVIVSHRQYLLDMAATKEIEEEAAQKEIEEEEENKEKKTPNYQIDIQKQTIGDITNLKDLKKRLGFEEEE